MMSKKNRLRRKRLGVHYDGDYFTTKEGKDGAPDFNRPFDRLVFNSARILTPFCVCLSAYDNLEIAVHLSPIKNIKQFGYLALYLSLRVDVNEKEIIDDDDDHTSVGTSNATTSSGHVDSPRSLQTFIVAENLDEDISDTPRATRRKGGESDGEYLSDKSDLSNIPMSNESDAFTSFYGRGSSISSLVIKSATFF
ncbi:hypothetical protein IMSHALPRED_007840 [Imshaugia aleurites]|uniref:Uncharacterized protein n=1 Tax=Imshaugia aleurites TaxID=172621 RepID=A0A8H3IQ25_9LECA|nr:hypothetical protein IMSHALPRED_007840 [Imshaugia aleurites]